MEAKIKKALKDLAVPPKPSATKTALLLADLIRKAPSSGQDAIRKQLLQRYEEKGNVWEGGALPVLISLISVVQEKPMMEAVSLALWQVLIGFQGKEAPGAAKVLVNLCKDKSLIVQANSAAALFELCRSGQNFRTEVLENGGLQNLTAIIGSADSDDALTKQGVNKAIPYKAGQRQEAAAGALRAISLEPIAQRDVASVGTLPHLISLCENCTSPEGVKTREAAAGALAGLLQETSNRILLFQKNGISALVATITTGSGEAQRLSAAAIKELSFEVPLREHLIHAEAVQALLTLCNADKSADTHAQAAAALSELANEMETKEIMLADAESVPILTYLLQSRSAEVQEKALGALGYLCVGGEQNRLQELLQQSEEGFIPLQDVIGGEGAMHDLVSLLNAPPVAAERRVANQALAALAAVCYRHQVNAARAATLEAVAAVVQQLARPAGGDPSLAPAMDHAPAAESAAPSAQRDVSGEWSPRTGRGVPAAARGAYTLQCNALRALTNLAAAYEGNRRQANRVGAGAVVLALWEGFQEGWPAAGWRAAVGGRNGAAENEEILRVAAEALEALRVRPQIDALGRRLNLRYLRVGPQHSYAATAAAE